MAAEDEGRTEQPSEYKLEKARKEGRVAKSQEISGALVLLLCVVTIVFLAKWLFSEIITIFKFYFTQCSNYDVKNPAFLPAFFNVFIKFKIWQNKYSLSNKVLSAPGFYVF